MTAGGPLPGGLCGWCAGPRESIGFGGRDEYGPSTAFSVCERHWIAPHLRSIGLLAKHIVRTRASWLYALMGEGGPDVAAFAQWEYIWHVIEHDLHHGGELSFSLGAHGLAAPDL